MIKINLLPFRAAKKLENIRMQISVYILSVILVCAVLGFYFMNLNKELGDLRTKNTELNKELASYSEMLKRIDALTKRRKEVQGKLDVIRGLEAQKAGPVQLFDEISIAVPKGKLFLKALGESGDRVTMSGVAKDYDTVALFMTNLENTHTIDKVTLGSTIKGELEEQTISTFSLTCTKETGEQKTKK
jgi:type IV pilus assembly protein PilN